MARIIPEMHTLGSINPHTLFVDVNRASEAEITAARSGGGSPAGWELYEHEARHWRDLVGTVWGRGYLDLLFATYDAVLTTPPNRMDTAYATVLRLFDADRAILFPAYYKYVLPHAKPRGQDERWSMGFSTGVTVGSDGELDPSRPFIFVRFDNGPIHIARQPMSIGTLMEVRAVAAEVAATTAWLAGRPAGEEVVTWRLKEPQLAAMFYDPQLTTYSVAAHVTAFATGMTDVRGALALADKLADISLTLTAPGFATLRPTADLGDPGFARLRGFRRSQSRGYAFCCLAFALREHVDRLGTGQAAIAAALRTAGLPTLDRIYADAADLMGRRPRRPALDPRLGGIRLKLLAAGRELAVRPDFDASVATLCPDGDAPAPLICDEGCSTFSLGQAPLDLAESEFLFDCQNRYEAVLKTALRAARGLDFGFTDYVY